jgi:hypothetical protein
MWLLNQFWHPFSSKSRYPENVYFATSTVREHDFSMSKAPILVSVFDLILMCFFDIVFALICPPFFRTWCEQIRFWYPFGARLEPQWHPKSAKWRQKATQKHKPVLPKSCFRSFRRSRRPHKAQKAYNFQFYGYFWQSPGLILLFKTSRPCEQIQTP